MAENNNVEVKLTNVRLSFPTIFRPKKQKGADEDAEPKYSAAFLMDKNTKQGKANIKIVEKAIAEAMANKWPKNPPKLKAEKKCLRDGDDESYDGYEDCMYVSASSYEMPTLANRQGKGVTKDNGLFYGGCYVNAFITIWAMDNDYGKRINAQLDGIQFVEDGESFSGRTPLSLDKFENLDGDDEDSDDEEDEDDEDDAPKKGKSKKSDKKSSKKSDKKPSKKSKYDDEDEDDDSDDEEDDEDEAPRKSKKSSKKSEKKSSKKTDKKSAKKSKYDDEDEDDDDDDDDYT